MRILFGGSNNIGSNIMISRFIQNSSHDIKVISYYRNHKYIPYIDYCLDDIFCRAKKNITPYFKQHFGINCTEVKSKFADLIINDLLDWSPDLVISDCEIFTASIAKIIELPLYYCSPLLQFYSLKNKILFLKLKELLFNLPKADKYLVYSPVPNLILKDNFYQVYPYYNSVQSPTQVLTSEEESFKKTLQILPNGVLLTSGETSFITDCINSGNKFVISPNPEETEQVLNARICDDYNVAKNIGRSDNFQYILNQFDSDLYSPPGFNKPIQFLENFL